MSKVKKDPLKKSSHYPFVSICTPTFNRRPFIPFMIQCFEKQTYPKDRMEWIIIDDGTDKIGDLVSHVPQVKYFPYNEKMLLGKKRNLMHEKSKGSFIVYMDDDDYYPPERVSHAIETLQKNPDALCAGSSEMYIYFKHIQKMIQCGPYGPKHSTAATFAFRRELLKHTRYDETAALAEERNFLKGYTIPFVQLDPMKVILVFSHPHNSFDKKKLLDNKGDPYIKESPKRVEDFIKNDPGLLSFYMHDIDTLLDTYEPGLPKYKPDVLTQIEELKVKRMKIEQEHREKRMQNEPILSQIQQQNNIMQQQQNTIQQLTMENDLLKSKVVYLEGKISALIADRIKELKNVKPV